MTAEHRLNRSALVGMVASGRGCTARPVNLLLGPALQMTLSSLDINSISASMQRYHDAGKRFKNAFREWIATVPEPWPGEPESVSEARRSFFAAGRNLWDKYLLPIDEGFIRGEPLSIDDVIAVLGIEIHCFRVGYLKASWLRRLKRLALDDHQERRLREIALAKFLNRVAGREMVEWNRLLIRIAKDVDIDILTRLTKHDDTRVRWRAERTLYVIHNSQPASPRS